MAGCGHGRILGALFCLAVLLRVGSIGALHAWQHPVAWENGAIAQSIADGHGFSFDYSQGEISNYYTTHPPVPTSFQAPFYPYLLAGFYRLGRSIGMELALALLLVLQALVGAALVIPAYHLGRILFSRAAGLASAALAAVYPAFIYAATIPHQAVWAVTGFALAFLALLALRREPNLRRAALYGALFGLLLLIEPIFLALMVAAFAGAIIISRSRARLALAGGVALALAVLVISPWLVRGYIVHGRFVFMKSSSGFNLWQGNNPAANGTPHSGWKHVAYPAPAELLNRLRRTNDELERDNLWRAAAMAAIRANPRRSALLFAKKALFFWTITPYHQLTRDPLYWLSYGLLLLPALGAMISLGRRLAEHLPVLLVFAAATVVYAVTFPGPRYRMPLEPLLFCFSAQGIVLGLRFAAAHAHGAIARAAGEQT